MFTGQHTSLLKKVAWHTAGPAPDIGGSRSEGVKALAALLDLVPSD